MKSTARPYLIRGNVIVGTLTTHCCSAYIPDSTCKRSSCCLLSTLLCSSKKGNIKHIQKGYPYKLQVASEQSAAIVKPMYVRKKKIKIRTTNSNYKNFKFVNDHILKWMTLSAWMRHAKVVFCEEEISRAFFQRRRFGPESPRVRGNAARCFQWKN